MTFDPQRALRTLVDHGVRFVLVGGLAGRLHGSTTLTNDLDVCHDRDPDNLERLVAALCSLNARRRGVDEDVPFLLDAKTLAAGQNFTFVTDAGDLDVLGTPSGTDGYAGLVGSAVPFDLGGFTVPVVALDDLIAMKRAAARRKDLIEVEVLLALRRERGED